MPTWYRIQCLSGKTNYGFEFHQQKRKNHFWNSKQLLNSALSSEICWKPNSLITIVIITWLALQAGKMNQIAWCDWLPELARWRHLARSGLPAVSREKNFSESHTINPLLTKFVRLRWLDVGLIFYCEFMDLDFISVHKHVIKELGQCPAILTSHLVNNPYTYCFIVHSKYFPILRSFVILLFVVSGLPTLGARNFTYSTNLPLRVLSQEDPGNKVATPPLECSVVHLLLCCVTWPMLSKCVRF